MSRNTYVYEGLQSQEYSRFLQIEPKDPAPAAFRAISDWTYEIRSIKRSEAPPFEAVSYAWGSAEKSRILELADGREFPTTASVFTALPYVAAHSETGYLWIDQICINQDDVQERNAQVQIMGDLYKEADRVVAWLGMMAGSDLIYLKELFHAVEEERGGLAPHWLDRENFRVASKISGMLSIRPGVDKHLITLVNFLDLPWFRRGWVFQEAVLCRSLALLVGDMEVKGLGVLDSLITALSTCEEKVEEFNQFSQGLGYRGALNLCNERDQRYVGAMWPKKRTFAEFLSETAGKEVTDPRDHLYGFLGFQNDASVRIFPDYDLSTEGAFTEATKAILAGTSSLDALNALREPRIPSEEGNEDDGLPSWVPDWSRVRWVHPLCKTAHGAYSPLFDASAGRKFVPKQSLIGTYTKHLAIRGREIASIAYVTGHQLPTEEATRPEMVKQRLSLGLHGSILIEECHVDLRVSAKKLMKVLLADGAVGAYMPLKSQQPLNSYEIRELMYQYRLLRRTVFPIDLTGYNASEYSKYNRLLYNVDLLFGLSQATVNRRVFCTSKGRLGLGPCIVRRDDRVIVAHGSKTPLVVRPCGRKGWYWLVGECYLEDSMHGEACTWAEDEADELNLV